MIPFEAALEAGAQDVETDNDTHLVTTVPEDFNAAREKLEELCSGRGTADMGCRIRSMSTKPGSYLLKFIDTLEDNDDVQSLSFNEILMKFRQS